MVRKLLLLALVLVSLASCAFSAALEVDEVPKEFDFLLFTQRWPETTCYEWMKRNHQHTCRLPTTGNAWTVHGIWPTRNGTKDGPFYCNKSMPFDKGEIKALLPKLNEFWTNVEKETPEDGLWKHEWEKHGTCASVLAPFHSENYYFGQGLSWFQTYSMGTLLEQSGIKPDSSVYVGQIHKSIYDALNTSAVIECYHETGKQFITEIRICFDKQLSLRDCDGAVGSTTGLQYETYRTSAKGTMITNCDPMKLVGYPSKVPKIVREPVAKVTFQYVKLYRIITFLRWFTF